MSLSARRAWIEMLALRLADMSAAWSLSARRAWIEIACPLGPQAIYPWSLSARRAWIEIDFEGKLDADIWVVALRKESVDRNMPRKNLINGIGSLSARRAWIEIDIKK